MTRESLEETHVLVGRILEVTVVLTISDKIQWIVFWRLLRLSWLLSAGALFDGGVFTLADGRA